MRRAIEASGRAIDAGLGAGASGILNRVTVSPGVIQGGLKINMLPGHCRIEVDIRLPVGLTHAAMMAQVERMLAGYPEARMTPVWTHSSEPSVCDPEHAMVGILKRTVRSSVAKSPWRRSASVQPTPSIGAIAACRPTSMAARPNNMAKADEWVDIEEYLHVVRTHALAAAAYLGA